MANANARLIALNAVKERLEAGEKPRFEGRWLNQLDLPDILKDIKETERRLQDEQKSQDDFLDEELPFD